MRAAAAKSAPIKPPPTLETFVQRCFTKCTTAAERDKMEGALKKLIGALDKDERARRDWSLELVPDIYERVSSQNDAGRWASNSGFRYQQWV